MQTNGSHTLTSHHSRVPSGVWDANVLAGVLSRQNLKLLLQTISLLQEEESKNRN